ADEGPVPRVRDALDRAGLDPEPRGLLVAGEVEHLDPSVVLAHRDLRSCRGERDAAHRTRGRVARPSPARPAGPGARGPLPVPPRDARAVRTEGDAREGRPVDMAERRAELPPRPDIPEADRSVAAARDDRLPVGAERHARDRVPVPAQEADDALGPLEGLDDA